jgi:hypothetical protein
MSEKSRPKSGWNTPNWRCTASEVNPILRPTMRWPASIRDSATRVCTA